MGKNSNPTNPEELVEYIASCLVEIKDQIHVESFDEDNKTISYVSKLLHQKL